MDFSSWTGISLFERNSCQCKSRFLFGGANLYRIPLSHQMNATAALGYMNFHDIYSRLFSGNAERKLLDDFLYKQSRNEVKWVIYSLIENVACFHVIFLCTFQWKSACPSIFTRNACLYQVATGIWNLHFPSSICAFVIIIGDLYVSLNMMSSNGNGCS